MIFPEQYLCVGCC